VAESGRNRYWSCGQRHVSRARGVHLPEHAERVIDLVPPLCRFIPRLLKLVDTMDSDAEYAHRQVVGITAHTCA